MRLIAHYDSKHDFSLYTSDAVLDELIRRGWGDVDRNAIPQNWMDFDHRRDYVMSISSKRVVERKKSKIYIRRSREDRLKEQFQQMKAKQLARRLKYDG